MAYAIFLLLLDSRDYKSRLIDQRSNRRRTFRRSIDKVKDKMILFMAAAIYQDIISTNGNNAICVVIFTCRSRISHNIFSSYYYQIIILVQCLQYVHWQEQETILLIIMINNMTDNLHRMFLLYDNMQVHKLPPLRNH